MPDTPDWKRALETGLEFTELRRSQARQLAADLVAQGELARDQVGTAVDEIVETSRRRSDAFRAVVRKEVQRQLGALGLATKSDLAALERKLMKKVGKKAQGKKGPAKKSSGKKASAKKSAAKQAAAPTSSPD